MIDYVPLQTNNLNLKDFISEITHFLNQATSSYENIIVMGDMNIDVSNPNALGYQDLKELMCTFGLTNLIKTKTCITWGNKTTLDLILSTKPKSHLNTYTFELGVSDFHKMPVTVLRLKPKIISYRSYKYFHEENFLTELSQNFILES